MQQAFDWLPQKLAIKPILLNQINPILRRPMSFLVTGKKGAITINRHAIGRAEAVGDAPALGAVLADLDDGAVMRHQPALRVACGLGKIKIPLGIRLQIHRKFMEMLSHLMVIIKILVKIHLAIIVCIV